MSASTHHLTAPEDRIPLKQKSAYAMGMLVNNLQAAALPAMVVILNLGLGMDALWVGLIVSIPRIFDAVSDPMVGYFSDNTQSRWGRRRPYILVGALLSGLLFALMWQLPSGYVDLVARTQVSQQVGTAGELSDSGIAVKPDKDSGLRVPYDGSRQADVEIHMLGAQGQAAGPGLVTDLTGLLDFPQVEVNVDLPQVSGARLVITEAGAQGESWLIDLDKKMSVDEEGRLYKFQLGDLKLDTAPGAATGDGRLDMAALQSVSLQLSGLQGSGELQVLSLKLRKSQDFFIKYFWFFLSMSILFFLCYTIYATPFVAFGYEMTPDYHERTRLHAFANTVGQLAWLGVPWFYTIMSSDMFRDTVHGAQTLAIWVGGTVALLGMIPALFCREKEMVFQPEETKKSFAENMREFGSGVLVTFKCMPFVKLCGATFLVFNGFQLGMSFSIYVMIYYLFNGNDSEAGKLLGAFGSMTAVATLVVIPLTAWIATRLGKRRTFLLTITLSMVGYALKWFGYNPDHPYWLLFASPLVAFGTGSLFTLMGSMISDVCDYDELQTNQRREGVFGAIYWWMVKVGMALAGLLTGVLLTASGFNEALGAGQADKTLFLLRVFDVGIPIITSVIALFIMASYGISETKAYEIRQELENRRGKVSD